MQCGPGIACGTRADWNHDGQLARTHQLQSVAQNLDLVPSFTDADAARGNLNAEFHVPLIMRTKEGKSLMII
jgi:hypothetical protein